MIKNLVNYSLFDYVGKIGVFGDLTFSVAGKNIFTPDTGVIQKGNETSKHSTISGVDITEFRKRKLRTITLKIKLIKGYVNIEEARKRLTRIVEKGEHYPLILGSQTLSDHDYIINSFSENIDSTNSSGNITSSTFNLNFEEYITFIARGEKISENIEQQQTEEIPEKELHQKNRGLYDLLEVRLW